MAKVFFLDSDVLSKFGRAENLSFIESLPGKLVITKEVYTELSRAPGSAFGSIAARNWLDQNLGNPRFEIDNTILSLSEMPSGGDAGEMSIANVIGLARLAGDINQLFVVSDSPQARIATGDFLGASDVKFGYQLVGDMLLEGRITRAEYFDLTSQMALVGPVGEGGIGGTPFYGTADIVPGIPIPLLEGGRRFYDPATGETNVVGATQLGTVIYNADGSGVIQLDGQPPFPIRPGDQVGVQNGQIVVILGGADSDAAAGTIIVLEPALDDPADGSVGEWQTSLELSEAYRASLANAALRNTDGAIVGNEIGTLFGSQLGQALVGDNLFAQLGAGTVLGTLTGNLGQALAISAGTGLAFDAALEAAFDDFSTDLLGSVAGAGFGAVSALLTAELSDALSLSEEFGGNLPEVAVAADAMRQAASVCHHGFA